MRSRWAWGLTTSSLTAVQFFASCDPALMHSDTMKIFLHVLARLAPCALQYSTASRAISTIPSLLIDTTARFSLRG